MSIYYLNEHCLWVLDLLRFFLLNTMVCTIVPERVSCLSLFFLSGFKCIFSFPSFSVLVHSDHFQCSRFQCSLLCSLWQALPPRLFVTSFLLWTHLPGLHLYHLWVLLTHYLVLYLTTTYTISFWMDNGQFWWAVSRMQMPPVLGEPWVPNFPGGSRTPKTLLGKAGTVTVPTHIAPHSCTF